jgi:hypothetical protein
MSVALVLAALTGCGEEQRPAPTPAESLAEHQARVARDPYALNCGDLARQPDRSANQRLVINAEFALAEEPVLRKRVEEMTGNRVGRSVYWALTEICKGRSHAYRPARAAVEAVRQGRYLVQPRPESWSDPERWSKPVIEGD